MAPDVVNKFVDDVVNFIVILPLIDALLNLAVICFTVAFSGVPVVTIGALVISPPPT